MKMTMSIEMTNDAFHDPGPELARILKDMTDSIINQGTKDRIIRDINGNSVGSMKFEENEKNYEVFHRTGWVDNPAWPNGREPGWGEETIIAESVETQTEAREICRVWNDENDAGRLGRRAEYRSI